MPARTARRAHGLQQLDFSSRGARRALHRRRRRLACGRRDGRRRRRRHRVPLGALRPGSLFCALRGARADGHEHAPAAVANGAVALLVERELPALDVPQIVCDDARAGMALLADALYGHPSGELDVVGVTGTNGKTTTTMLLAAILDAAGAPVRPARHRRAPHRRAPRAGRADDARGARPAARAALHARRRRRGLRDGGLVDRDRAAAPRGHGVRGGRLHEPLAGPPRLPRRSRDLLRGEGHALRRPLPARGQRRRRLRRAARGRAALRRRGARRPTCAARRSSCGPTAPSCSCARRRARSRSSRGCAGASTSTTCSAPSRSRCCWTCRSARSSAPWPRPARRPAASSRSRRARTSA